MSKNIGIVCEGPTDYILLRGLIDKITGEENRYVQLQPEDNLMGEYGNGWKGVWKWCIDHADILEKYMKDIIPQLDFLIIQMDGDVVRKEKEIHCLCSTTVCGWKGKVNPLECRKIRDNMCPIQMPCVLHEKSVNGSIDHLTNCILDWLRYGDDLCIAIPCDSTDSWVAAAYDRRKDTEQIEDPWNSIISKGKSYHGIRIPGHKKRLTVYRQFVKEVCEQWEEVKRICVSAECFEKRLKMIC